MAKCPSSVRSALIKLCRPSGPNFRSSSSSLRGCSQLGLQVDEKASALSPSNTSADRHFAWREREREVFPSTEHPFSPPGSYLGTNSRNATFMNNMWSKETPEFKLPETRWSQQSGYASSSFMLHPMISMPYRGLASGGAKDYAPIDDVPPTTLPPDGARDAAQSVKDWTETAYNGIVYSAKTVGESFDAALPPVKKILEDNPIIIKISIPLSIIVGAWVVMPRVFRRLHGYVERGSANMLQDKLQTAPDELKDLQAVPYELSIFKAMEAPAILFATLLTTLQVGVLITANTVVAEYLNQFLSGGSILCGVWFLHRYKSNVFKRLLEGQRITSEERIRYLEFDKFSSWGLIGIGALGVAKTAGMAVSSLLTVGGIGGIATAFAAREILANLLTGLTLSFSKPFNVGDTIKAGTVEGKVEEVGLISTRLLNLEKNPITVPNSYFTSQAIVNKSRAPWRSLAAKIPIRLNDFETIPRITMEIREMLYRNPQVFLDEDKPRCNIAQFSPSALEIAIACNIKPMSKNEYILVEQGILVEAARIITTCGATLGGTS